jgi:hypothetical protein
MYKSLGFSSQPNRDSLSQATFKKTLGPSKAYISIHQESQKQSSICKPSCHRSVVSNRGSTPTSANSPCPSTATSPSPSKCTASPTQHIPTELPRGGPAHSCHQMPAAPPHQRALNASGLLEGKPMEQHRRSRQSHPPTPVHL